MTGDEHIVRNENGEIVVTIEYDRDGWYYAAHGECRGERLFLSRRLSEIVSWVARAIEGDPHIEMSDVCWAIWSLEVSDGSEWWDETLEEAPE